ncbi:pre T-cell antigen receptor alpha isoform X1 [Chelonia mydas]|uniref:pre T-cell antigen receptor alpha isoform X1 n=1 Tax=Chelonia mydas TaxID=8469 RepID=UPI001CA97913|nr:pre T-cell antigen receptor alpha isoform X1 [Chelonia mydas]
MRAGPMRPCNARRSSPLPRLRPGAPHEAEAGELRSRRARVRAAGARPGAPPPRAWACGPGARGWGSPGSPRRGACGGRAAPGRSAPGGGSRRRRPGAPGPGRGPPGSAAPRRAPWAARGRIGPRPAAAGSTAAPFPTLAPPLTMVVNGERKTLVVCVVNDLSQDMADAIWFSNQNGSALDSFTYGVSREEDGTFSTVSHLSVHTAELESWESLACHVRQNRTAQVWSARSLLISEDHVEELCLDEDRSALPVRSQILLLLAIRVLLLKFLLFDILITCSFLFKGGRRALLLNSANSSSAQAWFSNGESASPVSMESRPRQRLSWTELVTGASHPRASRDRASHTISFHLPPI